MRDWYLITILFQGREEEDHGLVGEVLSLFTEILAIRKGMWATVASRLHTPLKIFPFGSGSDEVMLFGTVAYTLKDERKATVSLLFQFAVVLKRV